MDTIHGISFDDYAATNAFLAQGKPIEELLGDTGPGAPQWDEANVHFETAMKNDPEFKLAMRLGEIFQDPAVGKFAGASAQTTEDAIAKMPDLETYLDLQGLMSVALKYGVDPQAMLIERGFTVVDYSQAGLVHHEEIRTRSEDPGPEGEEFRTRLTEVTKAAEDKYEALFKAQAGGAVGDDIEF